MEYLEENLDEWLAEELEVMLFDMQQSSMPLHSQPIFMIMQLDMQHCSSSRLFFHHCNISPVLGWQAGVPRQDLVHNLVPCCAVPWRAVLCCDALC